MSADSAISPGLPVEVGEIDEQLGELWRTSGAGKVRASLINLVIYSEAHDAIEKNTPLLSSLASDHAFRALLVQADPAAAKSGVHAWITAHCHLRESGGVKEICSEQITFRLDGPAAGRLANIVFSHLDSDLPLCFWWQGTLHEEPDPQLWTRVDRLIVDSSSWTDPEPQFELLAEIETMSAGLCAVCDLTWTRLFHLRYAVAQIFDWPSARERLARLQKVSVRQGRGQRIAALELLGWLASRLGWNVDCEGDETVFRREDGGAVRFETLEDSGISTSISAVNFDFDAATAGVRRTEHGDFYDVEFRTNQGMRVSQMLPAGQEKTTDLLLSELGRIARHPLFWPAIRAVGPLLSKD